MQKNLDMVDEVTADQIRERNEQRQTAENRRKLATRRSIEEHQERLTLKRELEDGIGLDHSPVRLCLNCGNQLTNKPATAKFCKENCRKSYWKRNILSIVSNATVTARYLSTSRLRIYLGKRYSTTVKRPVYRWRNAWLT